MQIKKLIGKALALVAIPVLLASCGGGGGGGAAEAPKAFRITITAERASLLSNKGETFFEPGTAFASNLTIRIEREDGSVPGATNVDLSVNNASRGALSQVGDITNQASSLQVTTSAGQANAIFHTLDQTGNVGVTASAFDPTANRTVSATVTFNIDEGPDPLDRVTIEATRTTLPANRFSVAPFFNSPYISTLTIRYVNAEGTPDAPQDGSVGVAISPISLAAFSTLDDPSTDDINEFFVLLGNGPVDLAGGEGTIFIHSFGDPGVARITVSAQDPNTAEVFSQEFEIEIVDPVSDGLPANVSITIPEDPIYIQGSGGTTSRPFEVTVLDAAGVRVPDNSGGINNVNLTVLTERPNTGESLSGTNNGGSSVSGTTISVGTINGIAAAALNSGSEPGLVRIRAVSDAADNNVSNGVQAEVSAESTIVIGDGIPFSVTFSQLGISPCGSSALSPCGVTVNPTDPGVVIEDPDPTDGIPPDPSSIYSLRVGALVTDRFGNPPAQPVELQFGLIDSPLEGYPSQGAGTFAMSGFDGNPTEGDRFFDALTSGEFVTGGGGAGPGDTVILFGKDVAGNDDLESARTVDTVFSETSLRVDEAWNFNDFTGVSVNNGPELPYVIGRASVGNIESAAVSNSFGQATTFINYPASSLGRTAAVYVQGTNGPLAPNVSALHTFADAAMIRYVGLAPLTLVASPEEIRANVDANVLICVVDAAGAPVVGQPIRFSFTGSTQSVGSVDGIPNAGFTANATGLDGCTIATVTTSGVTVGSPDDLEVEFIAGTETNSEARDKVRVAVADAATLQAIPSVLIGNNTNPGHLLTLQYNDSTGQGVEDIGISGTCTTANGIVIITEAIQPTDATGQTTVTISADVDGFFCPMGALLPGVRDMEATERCTFSAQGGVVVTVDVVGRLRSGDSFSPSLCN